jgi:hypothetical protein
VILSEILAGLTKDSYNFKLLIGLVPGVSALSEERFLALHELLYNRLSNIGQVSIYILYYNNLSRGQVYLVFMDIGAWTTGLSKKVLLFKFIILPRL